MSKRSLAVVLLVFSALLAMSRALRAETWYVRVDGGTRYSAHATSGQCDGKADAPYPGHGTNKHCAFNDYRSLWDDRATYGKTAWVIAGGDTVIVDQNRKGWRVGFDQAGANDPWCSGMNGAISCSNPTIPSGTAGQHTRILGRNYEHCTADSAKTQIFGGHGVYTPLNLGGAAFVDVECLEITRHSQCAMHGDPILPAPCHRDYPFDDYDQDGIVTDQHTHDLLLQDLWIHGHPDRGIIGAIGGVVTAKRVVIAYNGMAGWDLDDGRSTPSVNATFNFLDSMIEWSGCNEEYPVKDANPVISCYGQSNGGYGDGIGTPQGMGLDVVIDHSVFRYNTQDGEDFGHVDTGVHKLRITNSLSYGNNGGQFKWGSNFADAVFANNVAIGNCTRLSQPIAGAQPGFDAHLADYCRAYDAISFDFRQGGRAVMENNTIVSYSPTTIDISCWDASCSKSTIVYRNNIMLGYENPATYSIGGKPGGPGAFYTDKPIGNWERSHNVFFGLRNVKCEATEICADPKFVNEPRFAHETDLDNFNFHLAPGSPALQHGMRIPELRTDYDGKPRPAAGSYTIGAVEP